MNPQSPLTYYRRHKGRALLLLALVGLSTLGVCVMVRLPDALVEQSQVVIRYLTRFSMVSAVGPSLEPGVPAQIRSHPGVARAIPEISLYLDVPMNTSGGFRLFGVPEADLPFLVDVCSLRLREGRLPAPRRNEIALSTELADTLGLHVGDEIGRSIDERYYANIPTTMVLVGILEDASSEPSEPGVLTGFIPYEYLADHELYRPASSGLIVVPREGRKREVDDFLEAIIASPLAGVTTYRRDMEFMAQAMLFLSLIFGVVDALAAVVIAVVVGSIHQMGMAQRLEELGLLHALGRSRRHLLRRLVWEMSIVAGVGWLAGLGLSWLLFAWLKFQVLPPTIELNLANLRPVWFAALIPAAIIAFVYLGTARTLDRFDAVAVIERGKLGADTGGPILCPADKLRRAIRGRPGKLRPLEAGGRRRAAQHPQPRIPRSPSPLSSWTFYLRHRRRAVALVVTVGLMSVGVVFPALLFAPMIDANWLLQRYLRLVSVVSAPDGTVPDPGVVAQVRSHPYVERVIPAIRLGLMLDMPPMNHNPARVYGVSEGDAQVLLDLYGVRLARGRLPHPHSNEIVVSEAMALNRGLDIGARVGRPAYELDYTIPTEMVVVGILSSSVDSSGKGDPWIGFASYEYLSSHELYASSPIHLLLVAKQGRKVEIDDWLQENVASERTSVWTYHTQLKRYRQDMLMLFLLCAIPESIIAIVAAAALAILSYTVFSQRREEYGILHAIGHSRRWLVRRTLGETASVVLVAWLLGASLCGAGLAYVQFGLYAPKGLTLDFFNPVPWLLTLPMPLAVITVGTGLVARMLSRLDPVAIIERR
jgi:ABC-type lipoprotein release transport system permease subunit